MFMFPQGGRAFALKIAHLKVPELRKLAADLPLGANEAKPPSTTERYSSKLKDKLDSLLSVSKSLYI